MSKLTPNAFSLLRSAEVRAYLLKPLPAKSSVEISEIQPAELAATDLDVRLTLVGTEGDTGEGYLVGEGADSLNFSDDEDGPGVAVRR
jgi:hypothetical protein